ncbi:hypothetical protein V6N13_098772 [Hibiscus sabdariffa]|uniref:Clp R domain-containing protein n=1 Tax=Hibiscus sabdariffa TaxID=183260 RepID=A0ABR2EIJ5_9ROSI
MRAGLSTIQQTLTPEAATVLSHSIAEASRRNHGQTTPLHVAAMLLKSPTGFLRQACIKSHQNSSHPLQFRALELCFSVALERLPTVQNDSNGSPGLDPPISNALMAALKRAQAHQRRGCPEQQQQPLLAVKVELEQLIISILDDPSVSRVMREASFSSPAVKSTIEQSLNATSSNSTNTNGPIRFGFRPVVDTDSSVATPSGNRNLYLNPRLQQGAAAQSGQQRSEDVKRVIDILTRNKKRNPILVGEPEPELVVKEILRRIESKETDGILRNVEVVHLDKEFASDKTQMVAKIKELGTQVGAKIGNLDCEGVILDLGDLKWLVESNQSVGLRGGAQQQPPLALEAGGAVVAEMGKLLRRFGEESGRLRLIGTATCETYLRCQVYHPSMENDWDLQAVPITFRASLPGMLPRFGNTTTTDQPRLLSNNLGPPQKQGTCPQCSQNYEQELEKLLATKDSESQMKHESTQPALLQWLQNAKVHDHHVKTLDQAQNKKQEMILEQKIRQVQKKWKDTCFQLHPNFHRLGLGSERLAPASLSITSLNNTSLVGCQPFQPKSPLNGNSGETLQRNPHLVTSQPGSPVRTDLVLGTEATAEIIHKGRLRDLSGCVPSEPQKKLQDLQSDKPIKASDADSFKKLLKGLTEKVWWQQDAASAVAATVTRCKLDNGKRGGAGSKGGIWLLFSGPDRIGKKKMVLALSDQVYGSHPVVICLGSSSRQDDRESDVSFRGKTVMDRIAEAVRRDPFSIVMLEDVDEADILVRGGIKRAMENGRLIDSYGREISLGNVIFILTASWLPDNLKSLSNDISLDDKKLASLANGGWQLRLSLSEKTSKRRASWLHGENRATKPKKETGSLLSFDLNKAANVEDEKADGSHNLPEADLTVDHEKEHGLTNRLASGELLDSVDDAIVFKPVDFSPIRRDIANNITKKLSSIIDERVSIEILDEALEKIMSGVWIGRTGLEEWMEKALIPSLQQLKTRLPASYESLVVRLELDNESCKRSHGDWLPNSVKVVVDGFTL